MAAVGLMEYLPGDEWDRWHLGFCGLRWERWGSLFVILVCYKRMMFLQPSIVWRRLWKFCTNGWYAYRNHLYLFLSRLLAFGCDGLH